MNIMNTMGKTHLRRFMEKNVSLPGTESGREAAEMILHLAAQWTTREIKDGMSRNDALKMAEQGIRGLVNVKVVQQQGMARAKMLSAN